MTAERWGKIKAIFDSALGEAAEDRTSFVEQACGGDDEMRREVIGLLREHEEVERTQTFLNEPIAYLSYSLTAGEAIGGRYRVVRLLGRGGMGEVYEVRDQLLDEAAALKTLRADLCFDASLVRRFQTEIQLARRVTHPNVCRVYEVGIHEFGESSRPPLPFFTMQLLEGETLAARIERAGRLRKREAFPLMTQMAQGLAAAHAVGIIHRDFKSANVMLAGGRAVITDFGLAGIAEGRAMAAGAGSGGSLSIETKLAGTVPYMSPEQLSGGRIGPASDIYSLGVVMFEMATGQLPFDDRHIIHSAMQRASGETPSVRALAPDIDPRWEAAIRRCLEVGPERRFASAAEIAEIFMEGGWRLPRVYWTRRQYALAGAGAAISLALGGTWWEWARRPYRAKPEAERWYERGVEALRAVTYEAARRDLEMAVTTDARYAPAYADLAAAYGELDQSERAKELMLQAVSIAQDERLTERDATRVKAMEHVIAREFDKAKPEFERLLALAPEGEKAGAYVDLAWLALKREDNPGMIPPLEKALKLDPGHAGAKLRLAIAMDRQGKRDAAQKLFEEAEGLFHTASNYNGELETLAQRAVSLGRRNRTSEAMKVIDRAMPIAASTGDLSHQIRLRLALALAYRNTGEIAKSRDAAELAAQIATDNRMDATAAVGLLDLGNAYLLGGEPEPSERYFRQGLELATRSRALFSEARGHFSLASLYAQYDRPLEAIPQIQAALKFFLGSGYRRESMQPLLLLGGVQEDLGHFDEAEKVLQQAIQLADQIHDTENSGSARLNLSSVFAKAGRWPESMAEKNSALNMFGEARGGYRAAYLLVARGRLWAQMGRFREAAADLADARSHIERLEGKQAQLHARLALGESEIAQYQARWSESLRMARKAAGWNGGTAENLEAGILSGLAMIHLGSQKEGAAACERLIRISQERSQVFLAASAELSLAEALWGAKLYRQAIPWAQSAMAFFAPRRVWEAAWRGHAILPGPDHIVAREAALAELKKLWPAELVRSYLDRPDIKEIDSRMTRNPGISR